MKITEQRTNALTAEDWLSLATLLVKAGYPVRLGSEKSPETGKTRKAIYLFDAKQTLEGCGA